MKHLLILNETQIDINNASDVFKNIKKVNIDYAQENFIVFALDCKNKIIKAEVLFKGGLAKCLVDPKIVFRFALLKKANCIIVAHNHPSNDLHPSEADYEVFEALKKAGKMLDLQVLDSVVFNKSEFYSLNS